MTHTAKHNMTARDVTSPCSLLPPLALPLLDKALFCGTVGMTVGDSLMVGAAVIVGANVGETLGCGVGS